MSCGRIGVSIVIMDSVESTEWISDLSYTSFTKFCKTKNKMMRIQELLKECLSANRLKDNIRLRQLKWSIAFC